MLPLEPVRRWRWWFHLLIIGGYPLLLGIVGAGQRHDKGAALTGSSKGLLTVCLVELAIFGLFLGLSVLVSKASRDDLLLRWRRGFLPVALGLGYSLLIRLVAGLAFVVVFSVVGTFLVAAKMATFESLQEYAVKNKPDVETVVNIKALSEDSAYYWLSLTLVSFVVAGLREELWRSASLAGLRNLWPQRFGSRKGEILGVLLTAVVFGLGHLPQGILGVALTGLVGACLGGIMIYHRSIWPAVLAHGFFDATSLALLPLVLKHA